MQLKTKIDIRKLKNNIKQGILILSIAIIFAFMSIYFYRYCDFGHINSNYLKSNNINELYDISKNKYLILNYESYEHFEKNCLGNKSSFLSQYGEIYIKGGLKCFSKASTTIISINNKEKVISDNASSYFNVIDNKVYFRNDNDFKLYSYNIKTEELNCIITEKVGHVIVSIKGISYISLSNQNLNFMAFNDQKKTIISDKKIRKYYVVGNKYLCLTNDSKLVLLDLKKSEVIDSDVENFVYNGNLVVQKGSNFYLYKTFNNVEKILIKGKNQIQTLDENNLYYVSYDNSETKLNCYDLNTADVKEIETIKDNQTVKGYYFVPERNILTTASIDSDID